MKFRVTIEYTYDVSDEEKQYYPSLEPRDMAVNDEHVLAADPGAVLDDLAARGYSVKVVPE